jgi:hypothetical protein
MNDDKHDDIHDDKHSITLNNIQPCALCVKILVSAMLKNLTIRTWYKYAS